MTDFTCISCVTDMKHHFDLESACSDQNLHSPFRLHAWWICAFTGFLICTSELRAVSVPPLSDIINPLPGPAAFAPRSVVANNTTHRVYAVSTVAAQQGQSFVNVVSVINADTDQVLSGISVGPASIDAIVVNEAKNLVYIGTVSTAPQVVVIDGAANQIKAKIDGVAIGFRAVCDPVTGNIFSIGIDPTVMKVNDGNTLQEIASIQLSDSTHSLNSSGFGVPVVNPTNREVYVAGSTGGNGVAFATVNADSSQLQSIIPIPTMDGPFFMAADATTNKLYALGSDTNQKAVVSVFASDSLQTTITLPAGDYCTGRGSRRSNSPSVIFLSRRSWNRRHRHPIECCIRPVEH